jgi:cyclomaltodextrinase / maltogenic alpha-amylase / neopullulanase
LHEFQRLIALRLQRPALRRGSFQFLWAAEGVVAVARQLDDETIVAILNANHATYRIDLPLNQLVADETVMPECWGRDVARVEQGKLRRLEVAPRSARIFATPLA